MKTIARLFVSLLSVCTAGSGLAVAQRAAPPPPSGDRVTAGGFITGTPTAVNGNFGVNARATLSGHLNYVDHGTTVMHVSSTSITSYTIVNPTTRTITGTCRINGVAGFTFTATLTDNGEPGIADTFSISLSSGYNASGTLVGGNVQLHPG